jgi:hypothetical protein
MTIMAKIKKPYCHFHILLLSDSITSLYLIIYSLLFLWASLTVIYSRPNILDEMFYLFSGLFFIFIRTEASAIRNSGFPSNFVTALL